MGSLDSKRQRGDKVEGRHHADLLIDDGHRNNPFERPLDREGGIPKVGKHPAFYSKTGKGVALADH